MQTNQQASGTGYQYSTPAAGAPVPPAQPVTYPPTSQPAPPMNTGGYAAAQPTAGYPPPAQPAGGYGAAVPPSSATGQYGTQPPPPQQPPAGQVNAIVPSNNHC